MESPGQEFPDPPDYDGGSLVNLVAELEQRLRGAAEAPPLGDDLAAGIPESSTYVLVIFDGLGDAQLAHPAAASLLGSRTAGLDAPFPTTTTVSLASVATASPPCRHGLLGYQMWLPAHDVVANTIKWTTLWGDPIDIDTASLLPAPNLWERLTGSGVESVTIQPAAFAGSSLSEMLYRGVRFEGAEDVADLISATLAMAQAPNRLVVSYYPGVDYAAHVFGQDSPEYATAVSTADTVWSRLASRLPRDTTLIGTSDHGHIDIPAHRQVPIDRPDHTDRVFWGDSRVMFVSGDGAELADRLPATWAPIEEMRDW